VVALGCFIPKMVVLPGVSLTEDTETTGTTEYTEHTESTESTEATVTTEYTEHTESTEDGDKVVDDQLSRHLRPRFRAPECRVAPQLSAERALTSLT
jgi:hypothetical protein